MGSAVLVIGYRAIDFREFGGPGCSVMLVWFPESLLLL